MMSFCSGRLAAIAVAVGFFFALAPARADVMVQIDKSAQRMSVSVDGVNRYNWAVSTGRNGFATYDPAPPLTPEPASPPMSDMGLRKRA